VPAALRNALPAVIQAHEAALAPSEPGFIVAHLAKLQAAFPNTGRDADSWKHFGQMAIEDLGEFPPDILLEAMRQHRRQSKFFPAISELREIAESLTEARQFYIERMRQLQKIATPEEREEQERVRAELKAAEREAQLAARPDLRIADKWGKEFWRGVSMMDWLEFLKQTVEAFGFETVDAWHAKASQERMFETDKLMPILCRLRDEERERRAA
jgi:hypothetical protein